MIKAAILGMGRWGQNLHQSVIHSDVISITQVCTRSPDKVKSYCEEHNIALTSDFDEVLSNAEIDAVILATPHTQHYQQIMQSAQANKHVFAEKPFTLSASEAKSALEALSEKNLTVGIGHNRRFAPNTQKLKSMLDQGLLGEITYIDGMFSAHMAGSKGQWRDSRAESPAGGMTSLGIHVIDMFLHLAGEMVSVSAQSKQLQTHCEFDDATIVNINFKAGFSGILTTLTSAPMQWKIRVYGTEGWAELDEQDTLQYLLQGEERQTLHFEGYDYPVLTTIGAGLEDFARAILEQKPFAISTEEILHATAVLDGIFRSVEQGAPVNI